MNHQLDAPFSEEEIRAAIDDLLAEKAPGWMGSPKCFTNHARR
jgi:hypothetical protein